MKNTICLVLALAITALFMQGQASTSISFIDVGQGDSTVLQSEGSVMLIDTGPQDARASLQKQLQACGVKEIDLLVLTHPHEDHDANFGFLVGHYKIGCLIMPEYSDDEDDYGDLLRMAVSKGTKIVYPAVGDQYKIGEAIATVFSAADPAQFPDDKNLWSIVLKIEDGDTSLIVMGDAEDINEYAMIDAGLDLDADILRVGHHGSSTSTTGVLLDAVTPDVAVISCGSGNQYGHPHQKTLDTLEEHGVLVMRTDLSGTIQITLNGTSYRVKKGG